MARCSTFFKDFLEPRRQETSNFMWISRELRTAIAYRQRVKPSPKWHKEEVLQSAKIQDVIRKICKENSVTKEEIEQQIRLILDEIGYNKRLHVIRWLGLLLTKICVKVCTGIHVNEASIMRLKQMMGNTPVMFLPSHRSYADFILMSYVCFTYDIEIPAIAAGMDFHGMWGMGTVLRDTGAFFMRRSFNDDSLYWETFRQYINQLVTKGDLPIEFFIEGTRSRSGKSLAPKFGLLSMILKPFFTSEVPDILCVPISISYDRVLEEKLFAYELLGVPKPKESTSAFFKSLSIVKERYGNIYIDFGEPISARAFFGPHIDRSLHSIKPLHLQDITQQEKDLTISLAHEIVYTQQQASVITVFNLVALSLTNNFISGNQLPRLDGLIEDVLCFKTILETLGACTDVKNASQDILATLNIHRGLVQLDNNLSVELVKNTISVSNLDIGKLKGHAFSQETMSFVLPFIMLQLYVNPVLHYLVNPAILVLILKYHGDLQKDVLLEHYSFLRSLYSFEFVADKKRHDLDFQASLQQLQDLRLICFSIDKYYLSCDKIVNVFSNVIQPFLFTYYVVCKILSKMPISTFKEQLIIVSAQAQLESVINKSKCFIHPYCLSLDTLTNCLGSLTVLSAIKRSKINGDMLYQTNHDVLFSILKKLETYVHVKLSEEDFTSVQLNMHFDSKL